MIGVGIFIGGALWGALSIIVGVIIGRVIAGREQQVPADGGAP